MRLIVIVLALNAMLPRITSAQGFWEELAGPSNSERIYGAYELIVRGGDSVFVLMERGVALSTNEGMTWERRTKGLTTISLRSMAADSAGTLIAISSEDGVFRSTDAGMSWKQSNQGIVRPDGAYDDFELWDVCYNHFNDTWYIASVNSTVLFSSDMGRTWSSVRIDTTQVRFQSILAADNGNVIVGDYQVMYTWLADRGQWMKTAASGSYLHRTSRRIFLTNQTGYLISDDDGETWLETTDLGGLINKRLFDMGKFGWYMSGEDAFLSTYVLHSLDSGRTWTELDTLWNYASRVYSMAAMPSGRILIAQQLSILLSDAGRSYWLQAIEGARRMECLNAAISKDGDVLAGARGGVFAYRKAAGTWDQLIDNFYPGELHVHRDGTILACGGTGIRRSTDNGNSWESRVLNYGGSAFIVEGSDGTLYTGIVNGTLYRSTDVGATWTPGTVNLVTSTVVDAAIAPDGDIFLLHEKQGVLRVNGALTQVQDSLSVSSTGALYSISVDEDSSILVSADKGLFHSSGAPDSWTTLSLPDTTLSLPDTMRLAPWMMDTDGRGKIFCLFRILDNPRNYGRSWISLLYETADHGATWKKLELPQPFQIYSMFEILTDGKMYLASESEGFFRSRHSVVSVDVLAPVAASASNDLRCWPQPARNTLTLAWDAAETVRTLSVHDCLGREVDRLALDLQASDLQRFEYDATRLRPGVFFFTMMGSQSVRRTRVVIGWGPYQGR